MQPNSQRYGFICGIVSAALFAIMTISIQQIPYVIPASQISFLRGMFTVVCLLPFVRNDIHLLTNLKRSRSIWFRSLFGAIAVLCFFWNASHGSAAEAKALANTNPLYVAIFSWFLFREKLNKNEVTGLFIILSGSFLLVLNMYRDGSALHWIIGNIGSIFTGAAYLSLKRASAKFNTNLIVFVFGICVMAVSAFGPGEWNNPDIISTYWIFLIGITGLFAQILLTLSHIHLKNTMASSLTLLNSLFLITYDMTLTKRLNSVEEIIGNVLILAGMSLMVIWRKNPIPSAPAFNSPERQEIIR